MEIFYYTVDILATIFDYLCLMLLLSNIVDHKKAIGKTVLVCTLAVILTFFMTAASVVYFVKMSLVAVYIMVIYKLLFQKRMVTSGIYAICFLFCMSAQECIILLFCKMLNITPFVEIDGAEWSKWQAILISRLIMFALTLGLKQLLKPFSEIMEKKSVWLPLIAGFVFLGLSEMVNALSYQYVEDTYLLGSILALTGIAIVGVMLYVYLARYLYSAQKEQEERLKVEVLEKQFAYYQEKQRDEERVRSIYHDMKNHLLLLQSQAGNGQEVQKSIQELQSQIQEYENYHHTGNEFLDIIIRDKAKTAQEKQIDFNAVISFEDGAFIDLLDISTIFGNALDNAIEASEKLPEDHRLITIRVNRVRDMLVIIVENNAASVQPISGETTKEDTFSHGFGLPNIRKAVERYGGQCSIKTENGMFILKILIPIP